MIIFLTGMRFALRDRASFTHSVLPAYAFPTPFLTAPYTYVKALAQTHPPLSPQITIYNADLSAWSVTSPGLTHYQLRNRVSA